jgi:hypothetical protein
MNIQELIRELNQQIKIARDTQKKSSITPEEFDKWYNNVYELIKYKRGDLLSHFEMKKSNYIKEEKDIIKDFNKAIKTLEEIVLILRDDD